MSESPLHDGFTEMKSVRSTWRRQLCVADAVHTIADVAAVTMRLQASIGGLTEIVELTTKKLHFAEKCVPRCATKRNCTSRPNAGDLATRRRRRTDAVYERERGRE